MYELNHLSGQGGVAPSCPEQTHTHIGGYMKSVLDSETAKYKKALLKGGLAAAAPGLVAVTAAFTAPITILEQFTGMGQMGVAALGVIFFGAAYFYSKGHSWAGIPSMICIAWALWGISAKAGRLLAMYYSHNPVSTLGDVVAPFPFISLQLTLVFIAASLGYVLFNTFWVTRVLTPQPVNRFVWGAVGLWGLVVVFDCMDKFQYIQ